MVRFMTGAALACALTVTAGAAAAAQAGAQTWTGGYLGGSIGTGIPRADADAEETVLFDTNLDGTFSDTVRTAAGADAFSPGFCGGIAVGSLPSAGCVEDEDGIDFGGRAGYDWQMRGLVLGALVDVSTTDVIDGVSAFSTTPAFYAFSRELNYVGGLRGRLGGGSDRVLVYGTGGAAWGSVDHQFTSSNGVNTFVPAKDEIRSEMAWGYQAGGGIEVRRGRALARQRRVPVHELERQGRRDRTVSGPGAGDQPVHPCERRRYRPATRGSLRVRDASRRAQLPLLIGQSPAPRGRAVSRSGGDVRRRDDHHGFLRGAVRQRSRSRQLMRRPPRRPVHAGRLNTCPGLAARRRRIPEAACPLVHRPHAPTAHDDGDFVLRDPHHQTAACGYRKQPAPGIWRRRWRSLGSTQKKCVPWRRSSMLS